MTKQNTWRTWMPRAFQWLEELQLEAAAGLEQGALHIVPTTCDKGKPPQVDTAALPVDIAERIDKAVQADCWSGHGDSHLLKLDEHYFLLLPLSKFDTSTVQKGRQVGIDAAKRLADFKFENIIICSTQLDPLTIFDGLVMGLYGLKFNHTPSFCGDDEKR